MIHDWVEYKHNCAGLHPLKDMLFCVYAHTMLNFQDILLVVGCLVDPANDVDCGMLKCG